MTEENDRQSDNGFGHSSWVQKFSVAFQGILLGIKDGKQDGVRSEIEGESNSGVGAKSKNSFVVHVPVAIAVVVLAIVFKFSVISIALLMLCIGLVFVAELMNSSIESLSRAVTSEFNEDVGAALDIASGAVLVASLVAVVVGVLLFASRLAEMF